MKKMESRNIKTGILGGGLTGITTGYLFEQEGWSFELLEKEEKCGGLMRTLHQSGFNFDFGGSHIIFSKNRKALRFMLRLLEKNKVKNRRNTKILYKGTYVKYPFENGLADLSKNENFECISSFINNLIRKERGELSKPSNLKEWFYYTFGEGIAKKYLIPYNEKIWKFQTDQIGTNWVERVPDPRFEDILKASLGIQTEGYAHQLHFFYPRVGGIEAIIKSMEMKMREYIINNFEVTHLRKEADKWIVSNGKAEREFDRIVATIPVQKLVEAIRAPREVKTASSRLKYNSLITVMLGIKKDRVNDLSWLYIPNQNVLAHRASFPSNFSPSVAPEGKSALLAEITCNVQDEIWNRTEQAVTDQMIDELANLKIIRKKDVCFTAVRKHEYAYVITDLEYGRNIGIVKKYFANVGIDLVGRFAEFQYLNMDACIDRAMGYVREVKQKFQS